MVLACRPTAPTAAPVAATVAPVRSPESTVPAGMIAPLPGMPGAGGHFVATSPEQPGSLDKDVIRTVVRSHIEDIRDCYNRGLERDPSLAGRVAIQFAIGGDGTVKSTVVQSSTLPASDTQTADCIAAAALNWRFPGPEGGGTVIVTYPFVLEPAPEGEPAPAK